MPRLCTLSFDGAMLTRGFWLYVWEITNKDGRVVHYLGKTGVKHTRMIPSAYTVASFQLGHSANNNALRRHLESVGLDPGQCSFRFHAYGPVFDTSSKKTHGEQYDIMAGLETGLSDALLKAGYDLLNPLNRRMPVDETLFAQVRRVLSETLPRLAEGETP